MIPIHNTPAYISVSQHKDPVDEIIDNNPKWVADEITDPLHQQEEKKPKKKKKSVSFHRRVQFRTIITRKDYTREETKACWYTDEDESSMRLKANVEANLLDWGHFNHHSDTPRGLEGRTAEGSERKRLSRMEATVAVLLELEFQDEEGIIDEETIAEVYIPISQTSASAAELRAKDDAAEAQRIYQEDDELGDFSMVDGGADAELA